MSDVKIAIENRLAMVLFQRDWAQQQLEELKDSGFNDDGKTDDENDRDESVEYAELEGRVHMWTQAADELNGLSKDLGINNVVRAAESIMIRIQYNRNNGMGLSESHTAAIEEYRNH